MPDLIYQEKSLSYQVDGCAPQVLAAKEGKIKLNALTNGGYPGVLLPEKLLSEVSSMGFIDAIGQQDWGMEEHRNEGVEICLQERGENIIVVDGKKYKVPAKTLSITRPWQLHRVGDPYLGPGRLHWIILDVGVRRPNQKWEWPDWCIVTQRDLGKLTRLLRGNEQPVWKANTELIDVFQKLAHYTTSENPEEQISRIKISINQLLISLLDLLDSQEIKTNEELSSLARTVELFLIELARTPEMFRIPWTLESMAGHCGLGRSAFTKYCYQFQNAAPIDYLNRCRLKHAAQRLRAESQTAITDIAFDLGFSSSQYFCRMFKRQFGCPPSAWRVKNETV